MTKLNKTISILALTTLPVWAIAAGDHDTHGTVNGPSAAAPGHDMGKINGEHNDTHESMAGMAGDAAKVSRTIPVEMNDNMRFTPANVTVKAGETVRFFIVNKGKIPHEMVIGTAEEIDEHADMMKKMPGMAHKEANQITLAPGQRGALVWQFAKTGTVTYACLVPGHKEAGMVGTIDVN
tara:strand:+ start:7 stop:546 length:540 start_codon:yes stop_codon:yes gene_type:complete